MEGNSSQDNVVANVNEGILVPVWIKIALTAFIGIAFVIGIPGNYFVILLHVRLKKKTLTDWMVFYLAACDVISLVVRAPCAMLIELDVWPLFAPDWLCRFYFFVLFTTFHAAAVIISCLAVYRFKATSVERFAEKDASTKGKYMGLCIIILCLLSAILRLFTVQNNANGYCVINSSHKSLLIITYAFSVGLSVTSCIVTCVFYSRVAIFFRRWRRVTPNGLTVVTAMRRNRTNSTRTTLLMLSVALVFVLSSLLPMSAGIVMSALGVRSTVTSILTKLSFVNNFANPILYVFLSPSFRTAVLKTIRCQINRPKLTSKRDSHRNQINAITRV